MVLICPHCGHENIAGADFCEACRHDLQPESIPQPTEGLQKRIMSESLSRLHPSTPILVTAETPLSDVIRQMQERQQGSALIVNEEGELIGIVTDRDIIQKVGFRSSGLEKLPVGEVMTHDPVALKREDSIAFALNKMCVGGFRHIPIVKDGKPTGTLTVKDLFHHLCQPESEAETPYPD